ncbi:MAG TPA: DUF305 domain-containing protein [Pyrinomonadaceae bacterium]|nr:DUF305 domain-containing protein [Pyrinomonadaceae bacterium]
MEPDKVRLICFGLVSLSLVTAITACGSSGDKPRPTANNGGVSTHTAGQSPTVAPTPMEDISHDSAMKSSPGAASAPFDLQFIDTMSEHHTSGIEMAKDALASAEHSEVKNLARQVVIDQQREVEQMSKWTKEYK